jgi:hypothetical protein
MGVKSLRSLSHEHPLTRFGKTKRSISIDSHHPINVNTLKCIAIRETLKIGKNGVKEDLMVPLDVNKLFLDICQIQPITLTIHK